MAQMVVHAGFKGRVDAHLSTGGAGVIAGPSISSGDHAETPKNVGRVGLQSEEERHVVPER